MPLVSLWSYLALAAILAVSSAGPPLPATLSLALAAVAVRQGHDPLFVLIIVATIGTVLGDITGYWFGRLVGLAAARGPLARWEQHWMAQKTAQALAWLDQRGGTGGALVFVSRWGLSPIAPAINLIVGARRYPFPRFLLFDAAGEMVWVLRVAVPAYLLGHAAGLASLPLAVAATVVIGAIITMGAGRLWPLKERQAFS